MSDELVPKDIGIMLPTKIEVNPTQLRSIPIRKLPQGCHKIIAAHVPNTETWMFPSEYVVFPGKETNRISLGTFQFSGSIDINSSYVYDGFGSIRKNKKLDETTFPLPLSEFYSIAYAEKLALHRPTLYLNLHGISPESEEGKLIIAAHAAKRMGVLD